MVQVRKSEARGHANHGWLKSHHTFSFASYHDPKFTGFRDLLVINEDQVAPAQGFGKHSHDNMEIVSYVLSGELEHRDSMGNGSVLKPGTIQRMSAGTGVTHSEFNASKEKPVHFFQIWILPEGQELAPGYEEKYFDPTTKQDQLRLLVSRDGREGSIRINQDVALYASLLSAGKSVEHAIAPTRGAWVQVASGVVELNGTRLQAGDGAAITDEQKIAIQAIEPSEFLVFDLA